MCLTDAAICRFFMVRYPLCCGKLWPMRPSILLLTALLSIGTILLSAQSALIIEPGIVRKQVTVNLLNNAYEEVARVSVRNTSGRTLRLRWNKVVVQQPAGWESQICDDYASYPPTATTNYDLMRGINAPVILAPGEAFDMYLHLFPYGKAGEATIEIPFRLIGAANNDIIQRAIFHIRIEDENMVSSSPNNGRITSTGIRIYPNPVDDRFYISNAPAGLTRVDIVNSIGRKVRSFERPDPSAGFSVSDLPEGVYLVSLIDEKGRILRTLRMIRRGFRP